MSNYNNDLHIDSYEAIMPDSPRLKPLEIDPSEETKIPVFYLED